MTCNDVLKKGTPGFGFLGAKLLYELGFPSVTQSLKFKCFRYIIQNYVYRTFLLERENIDYLEKSF